MDCFVPNLSMRGFRSSPLERLVVILAKSCTGSTSWEVYRGSCAKRRQGGSGLFGSTASSKPVERTLCVFLCGECTWQSMCVFTFRNCSCGKRLLLLLNSARTSFFPSRPPISLNDYYCAFDFTSYFLFVGKYYHYHY